MANSSRQSRFRLANQILDVIRDARFEPGHHLREQQLGDLDGVAHAGPRGADAAGGARHRRDAEEPGLLPPKPFDALQRIEIEVPATVDQELYQRLVRDRLADVIPNSLTQSEIARRYDVDRVALLRTLSRLAEDGLVARNKGHGWTFLPTLDTMIALRSSYDFRLTLEPAGFLLPTFRPDRRHRTVAAAAHLSRLASEHRPVSNAQLFDTDATFHEMFAEFTGNIFFLQAIQQQNRLRRLLEFGGYGNRRRVRDWCHEHIAIIEAIATGDLSQASAKMHLHLEHALAAAPSRRKR